MLLLIGRCPSANNPRTTLNETDCHQVRLVSDNNGGFFNLTRGEHGNLCHIDCANQGICDYSTGTCACFEGQYGSDCSLQVQVSAKYQSSDGVYAAQPMQPGGEFGMDGGMDYRTGGDMFADYL